MKRIRIPGKVDARGERWICSDQNRALICQFKKEMAGKRVGMDLYQGDVKRSLAQNAFFHGPLIDAFVRATGETNRRFWKAYLKEMFLGMWISVTLNGVEVQTNEIRGTSALSVSEFSNFIDQSVAALVDQHGGHLVQHEMEMYRETQGVKQPTGGKHDTGGEEEEDGGDPV